eukprot:jgi/Mesvir1/3831/Mv19797-RA.3
MPPKPKGGVKSPKAAAVTSPKAAPAKGKPVSLPEHPPSTPSPTQKNGRLESVESDNTRDYAEPLATSAIKEDSEIADHAGLGDGIPEYTDGKNGKHDKDAVVTYDGIVVAPSTVETTDITAEEEAYGTSLLSLPGLANIGLNTPAIEAIRALSPAEKISQLHTVIRTGNYYAAATLLYASPTVLLLPGSNPFACLYDTPAYLRSRMGLLLVAGGAELSSLLRAPHDHGTDVDPVNHPTRPVHIVAHLGLADVLAEMLLVGDAEVDVNARGGAALATPLHVAIQEGHLELAADLLSRPGIDVNVPDNKGRTPIFAAIKRGADDMVHDLHAAGARLSVSDKSSVSPFLLATENKDPSLAMWILEQLVLDDKADKLDVADANNTSPLHVACLQGHLDLVMRLLVHGADVMRRQHSTGRTPLLQAAYAGQLKVVEALVESMAGSTEAVTAVDLNGRSALHEVCSARVPEDDADLGFDVDRALHIVRRLVDNGSKVECRDFNGRTPLRDACVSGVLRLVNLLLDLSADIHAQDSEGRSPLQNACQSGAVGVVLRLLDRGAMVPPRVQATMLYQACANSIGKADANLLVLLDQLEGLRYPLHRGLQLYSIYSRLATDVSNNAATEEYLLLAEGYEATCLGLLRQCRTKSEELDLLQWKFMDEKTTILDQAMAAAHKKFIAHSTVQQQLEAQWGSDEYTMWVVPALYVLYLLWFPLALLLQCMRAQQASVTHVEVVGSNPVSPNTARGTILNSPTDYAGHQVGVAKSSGRFDFTPSRGPLFPASVDDMIYFYNVPKVKFFGDFVSYLLFLSVLVSVLEKTSMLGGGGEDGDNLFSDIRWIALAVWLLGLATRSIRGFVLSSSWQDYLGEFWNVVDVVILLMFVVFVPIHMVVSTQAGGLVLAFLSGVCVLRVMAAFQASPLLGPLELMARRMFVDVLRFFALLAVFVCAFAVALRQVYLSSDDPVTDAGVYNHDLKGSIRLAYWSLYGIWGLSDLEKADSLVEAFAEVILALYNLVAVVVLLNLLIALMTSTVQRIQDNTLVEYRFQKAKLIRKQM